jgi:hypothetical protein
LPDRFLQSSGRRPYRAIRAASRLLKRDMGLADVADRERPMYIRPGDDVGRQSKPGVIHSGSRTASLQPTLPSHVVARP